MKFSEKWLREWEDPQISTEQLAEQLSMHGLEVDSVTSVAGDFEGVVVGHVVECKQHPDADRLNCCKVDVGGSELLSIVCGGRNVRQGLKVAVVQVGGRIGELKIKKAKLRGELSQGMICSMTELGLAETSEGIMELPEDAVIGMDISEYLKLDDFIIDIEITPNRGDCLSIRGIARDNAAVNHIPFKDLEVQTIMASHQESFPVKVKSAELCPYYVGRVIKDINPSAKTPLWMQEKLRRSGIRCIQLMVDICNYVMIELGQPMHAFDLDKLKDGIVVRQSEKGERITLLDGKVVELQDSTLIIADGQGPQAIAGVMGAQSSAVSDSTTTVFLEAAYFNAVAVTMATRDYAVQSDSSFRFERGVDYKIQRDAIERASDLVLQIAGGQAGPVVEVINEEYLPIQKEIQLRAARISAVLGCDVPASNVVEILEALGMGVKEIGEGWQVIVPSYRSDIAIEADLIEEVGRLYGFDNIPAKLLSGKLQAVINSSGEISTTRIKNLVADMGYNEVVTYSFVDPGLQRQLDPELKAIKLANPMSAEMSEMRGSLWPGLVKCMEYNQNRQSSRQRLFEVGLCFRQKGGEWLQVPRLGMLAVGTELPEQWSVAPRKVDFYDIKGDVMGLLELTGDEGSYHWEKGSHPALHPGQQAALYRNDQLIGNLGSLHPKIAQQMGLNHVPFLYEVDLSEISQAKLGKFRPVSKFPSVRRDLSVLVDQALEVDSLLQAIKKASGDILNNIEIFDIYLGDRIARDKKSVALGLTFQDPWRTLLDTEINEVIQNVINVLESDFNATLRA